MAGHKRCGSEAAGPSRKASKRQVTKSTFDKWQQEYERDHQTLSWLRCDLERDKRHVATLYCAVCKKYEDRLQSLKSFSRAWITGSTNHKVSNVLDHAASEVHKVAMTRKRADDAKASGGSAMLSSTIGRCLATLDSETRARMERKFDLCYVMAKQSIPFAKYSALIELEQRHEVDIGRAYNTADSARLFTSFIAKSQRQGFLNSLHGEGFFSLLMDGSTDAGNVEDELIVLVHCHMDDTEQEMITTSRFLSLHNPQNATASGLLECIGEAMRLLGVEDVLDQDSVLGVATKPVLIGVGTDGATVNIGAHNGLRGQMQRALPWLFWSWCYAHRLELAYKAAFSSSLFKSLQEMLLRLYYLYEKSPKKSRELENITTDLKQVFDLSKGGNRPIRSCGTRWVTHTRKALQRVVDRYGVYIAHLSTLVEDTSRKASDRAHLTGYLRKWKKPEVLVSCALYIEGLKPVSLLSLTLQGEKADIVSSIENTLKSVKSLQSLIQKDPKEWAQIQLLKKNMKEVEGKQEYQGFPIADFDATVDQCKVHVLADLKRLEREIKHRLEWTETGLLRALLVFLETQNWQEKDTGSDDEEDMADIRAAVQSLVSTFRIPLESRGVCMSTIQDELEEAVEYARKYLAIGRDSYRKIWYKLHTCPDSSKWSNLLQLSKLVFSLPFTTSRVEQIFSKLKVIKTSRRTGLHNTTLCDLLEISIEGPDLSEFSACAAIDMWWKECRTTRRVNQNPRKEYRPQEKEDREEEETPPSFTLEDWDEWMAKEV